MPVNHERMTVFNRIMRMHMGVRLRYAIIEVGMLMMFVVNVPVCMFETIMAMRQFGAVGAGPDQ